MNTKIITTDRCMRICNEQANLEGTIALPYENADLSAVLEISGCAEVTSALAETERVIVSGRARYTILYLTKSGAIDSFDSECGFEHTILSEEATAEMRVLVGAKVTGTSWRVENGAIELRSGITLSVIGILTEEHEILEPTSDDEIQCDSVTAEVISCSAKSIKAYVNDDLRIGQNLPEAQKILCIRAQVAPEQLQKDLNQLIAEGVLHVCILYESADKNAPLQYVQGKIPFGEIVKDSSCGENSAIFADFSVDRITAELTSGDTIAISGVISIHTLCVNRREQVFLRDLYSLTHEIHPTHRSISMRYPIMLDCIHKNMRTEVHIPESAPEAARVLYAAVQPEITGMICEGEQLSLDGLLHITLIYSTPESGMKSIHLREPFELDAGRFPEASEVRAFCSSVSAQGSGRAIEVKSCMNLCICAEKDSSLSAVTSAEISGDAPGVTPGILVYFADDGEKIWDICKRCCVPTDSAIPLDSTEPLHRGDRVLILR